MVDTSGCRQGKAPAFSGAESVVVILRFLVGYPIFWGQTTCYNDVRRVAGEIRKLRLDAAKTA